MGLAQGLEGWVVLCLCELCLDFRCRWKVQVSVYCAWRIPAHLRCTQCSILLHFMDICFLTCIYLWQISQIQTFLCVFVGPGFSRHHPLYEEQHQPSSGSAWQACQKMVNREGLTQFAQKFGTAVTAPPLVGCVVWSLFCDVVIVIVIIVEKCQNILCIRAIVYTTVVRPIYSCSPFE